MSEVVELSVFDFRSLELWAWVLFLDVFNGKRWNKKVSEFDQSDNYYQKSTLILVHFEYSFNSVHFISKNWNNLFFSTNALTENLSKWVLGFNRPFCLLYSWTDTSKTNNGESLQAYITGKGISILSISKTIKSLFSIFSTIFMCDIIKTKK